MRERNERGREKASQTWKVLGFLVGSNREVSNGEMERKWRAFILYGSATYMQQAQCKAGIWKPWEGGEEAAGGDNLKYLKYP